MAEDERDFIDDLDDDAVRFVTIEIIQNGFTITLPELAGKENAKFHRVSLEGVKRLLQRVWEKEKLIENTIKTKSDVTLDDGGKLRTVKVKVAKKKVPKKK